MEHSPFRDLFNLLKPTTPHEIPWKVHFKAACRTGSFESFRKLLDIILDSFLGNVDGGEPKIVTEIHQRIKNHLNPYTKDTNRIIHCLSFVCYLATTEHEIVREYFWNNDIKQLILQLQGCSKEGAPGGGDWELIKKKASEVKQTVALDNARRVQGYGKANSGAKPNQRIPSANEVDERPSILENKNFPWDIRRVFQGTQGTKTSTPCPKCNRNLRTSQGPFVLFGECSRCDYIFCTVCKNDYHGGLDCNVCSVRRAVENDRYQTEAQPLFESENEVGYAEYTEPADLAGALQATQEQDRAKTEGTSLSAGPVSHSETEEDGVARKCPRCRHNDLESDLSGFVQCKICNYIFCRRCNENYHGISACQINILDIDEQLLNLQFADRYDDEESTVAHQFADEDATSRQSALDSGSMNNHHKDTANAAGEQAQARIIFTCNTCADDFTDPSELAIFAGCAHNACKGCVKNYFDVQIRDGNVHGLKCLEGGCEVKATAEFVKAMVDQQMYTRFDEFLLNEALADDPEIVNCPNASCQKRVYVTDGIYGYCEPCNYRFCTACSRAYHGLVECGKTEDQMRKEIKDFLKADEARRRELERQEVERRRANDAQCEGLIRKICKKCPGCRADIEKNEGCNHMVCTKCNTDFCWLCLAITNKNSGHYNAGRCPLFFVPPGV